MKDLYEAIGIFLKYSDEQFPSWCTYDELHICVEPEKISLKDIEKLEKLSFTPDDSGEGFYSFRFGSC
jgi:hypothetical protein